MRGFILFVRVEMSTFLVEPVCVCVCCFFGFVDVGWGSVI